jgi:hypothetical protein
MSLYFKRLVAVIVTAVLSVTPGISRPTLSEGNREFSGFYQLSDIQDLGLDVALILSVRVYNHTGSPITGATVRLQDSVLVSTTYATFAGTAIPQDGSIDLTANVTIPHSEFDFWRAGGTPRIEIDFKDAKGVTVHRLIELAPQAGREE